MSEVKFSILNYIEHFSIYDYLAYIWLLLIFFILIIFSLLIIKKSAKLSLLLILLSFIFLFVAPFVLKSFLDKTIRPIEIYQIKYQKLHFSNTLIVDFKIKNISKKSYNMCLLDTKIYKPSNSKIENFLNRLKPIRHKTIIQRRELKAGDSMKNRVIFYNFSYNKDINISANAECYGEK